MGAVSGAVRGCSVEYETDRDAAGRFSDADHGGTRTDAPQKPGLRSIAGVFCKTASGGRGKGEKNRSGLWWRSEGRLLSGGGGESLSEPVFRRYGKLPRVSDLPEGAFPDGGAVRHPSADAGLRPPSRLYDDAAGRDAGRRNGASPVAYTASSCPRRLRDGGARAGAMHRCGVRRDRIRDGRLHLGRGVSGL